MSASRRPQFGLKPTVQKKGNGTKARVRRQERAATRLAAKKAS